MAAKASEASGTSQAPQPRALPKHGKVGGFELRNNWPLRRAGIRGWRVKVRFDGAALVLEGSRRGSLRIQADMIEKLLVGAEHEADVYWTSIWSSATRRSVMLKLRTGKWGIHDYAVWRGYSNSVRELAWGLQQRGEFGRVRMGRGRWPVFLAILVILSMFAMVILLPNEATLPFWETPLSDHLLGVGLIVLVILAVAGSALYACIHRRVQNIVTLDAVLPTETGDRSGRFDPERKR
jgi:hypothetical protein